MSSESVTPESLKADGWRCIDVGGFTGLAGPFWLRDKDGERTMGLQVQEHHTNNHMGTLHGGVVMTFADIALGSGVANVLGDQRYNSVTLSLQTQFVSIARIGDFITCTPEIVRQSKQIVFVRGLIKTGEKTIASVEGLWKLLGNRD